jgi:hypothetical protein
MTLGTPMDLYRAYRDALARSTPKVTVVVVGGVKKLIGVHAAARRLGVTRQHLRAVILGHPGRKSKRLQQWAVNNVRVA